MQPPLMTFVAVALIVGSTYLVTRYRMLVQAVADEFEEYDARDGQEYAFYDVKAHMRRVRLMQWVYFGVVTLLYAYVY